MGAGQKQKVHLVSNSESFIDEVTEEVRRDKLFALFRKYGWIAVMLVLGVVGGTAYNEWQKAQTEAAAQAFGDSLQAALDLGTPEERRAALSALATKGDQAAILQLILASDPDQDRAATLAALDALAADDAQPQIYRDLATLRSVIVAGADRPVADRRAALDPIAAPGRPFRVLALEQLAYLSIEEGKPEAAISALQTLMQDQEATDALTSRAAQVIEVLGGDVEAPADAG